MIISPAICFGQTTHIQQLEFLIGEWNGTGSGFGNETSTVKSFFKPVMNEKYIEFKNESIENFVPGGKARWTIKKTSENQIETIFDVAFPNSDYSCMGVNKLKK